MHHVSSSAAKTLPRSLLRKMSGKAAKILHPYPNDKNDKVPSIRRGGGGAYIDSMVDKMSFMMGGFEFGMVNSVNRFVL